MGGWSLLQIQDGGRPTPPKNQKMLYLSGGFDEIWYDDAVRPS